jgi:predicted amidohydrolase
MPEHQLRIAIGQLQMHWTLEENLLATLRALDIASANGAHICLFPELSITGFHRDIVALAKPEIVAPALQQVSLACQRLGIAAAVGAPTFDDQGAPLNSYLLIDEHGRQQSVVSKIGLTESEATFFKAGHTRPLGLLQGVSCSAVICREIEDQEQVFAQLANTNAELVLWPGQMGPDRAKPRLDIPEHVLKAQAMAARLGTHLIQANWPNALNRPEESAHCGHSAVISPAGELLFRLPEEAFGVGVFDLGAHHYQWISQ